MLFRSFSCSYEGFIGGSVLQRFLEHKDASHFEITALVRSPVKAEKLRKIGVKAVTGSLDDVVLTENLASEADVVISKVRSFLLAPCKAPFSYCSFSVPFS